MTCALCGRTVGGAEPAHAVRDKSVCEACRRLVSALEPRTVLPYAHPGERRRRWVWPTVAAVGVVLALAAGALVTARSVAIERARAQEMRALMAEAQARIAAAAATQSRPAATQPGG